MEHNESNGWGANPSGEFQHEDFTHGDASEVAAEYGAAASSTNEIPPKLILKDELFLEAVNDIVFSNTQVTIVSADPGTGKSTILPFFLTLQYEAHVVVTEPRIEEVDRLYNRAKKLAESSYANIEVLRSTGRKNELRAAARRGPKARLIYATDGKVANSIIHGRLFGVIEDKRDVFRSFLVIDEIHEMNLNMEIIVAKARDYINTLIAVGQAHEFQLFIMSATIQSNGETFKRLQAYLDAGGIDIAFRIIENEPQKEDLIEFSDQPLTVLESGSTEALVSRIEDQVNAIKAVDKDGGILVFVSSMFIAMDLRTCLQHHADVTSVHIVFRGTSATLRQEALNGGPGRIVICSNIAESSTLIQNIDYVIDTGTVRRSRIANEVVTLYEEKISQGEAIFRAARLRRGSPGKVYRLYTIDEFENFSVDPPSQSSREDPRMVVAIFCTRLGLERVSCRILEGYMVSKHNRLRRATLRELAYLGLLIVTPDVDSYEVNKPYMEIFVKQFSNFAPSYVAMRLTISHSRFYEVYVAAQSLLGASSSLWMTFGATSLYPEDDRPQTSEKNRFNDGFSEMTTVLKVYHKFITSQNPRQFCNQNGILIDAIYEAEKQYQSIVGKPMRHCSALEMVVQQNKLLQHEVMSHMYVATLNENTLKYVIVGMDYPADIRQSDAIYVDPSNISLRHKHVLCDGYFSPVDGKYFLVNTMRHPDA